MEERRIEESVKLAPSPESRERRVNTNSLHYFLLNT